MMTVKEWLTENRPKYTNRTQLIKDCVREFKCNRKTVYKWMAVVWPNEKGKSIDSKDAAKDIISTEEFLTEVDVVRKILTFLDDVVADRYIEDDKLRKRFDVSNTKWREVVRLPIFEGRSITYEYGGGRKKTVWSSIEGIDTAKQTISMARYDV